MKRVGASRLGPPLFLPSLTQPREAILSDVRSTLLWRLSSPSVQKYCPSRISKTPGRYSRPDLTICLEAFYHHLTLGLIPPPLHPPPPAETTDEAHAIPQFYPVI